MCPLHHCLFFHLFPLLTPFPRITTFTTTGSPIPFPIQVWNFPLPISFPIPRSRHVDSVFRIIFPTLAVLRCRIPAQFEYRVPLRLPESRDASWFANVPHKELTVEKKNQNVSYIDDIGKLINLKDGSIRTALDTGCGIHISGVI